MSDRAPQVTPVALYIAQEAASEAVQRVDRLLRPGGRPRRDELLQAQAEAQDAVSYLLSLL